MKSYNNITTQKFPHNVAVGRFMEEYAEQRLFDSELGKELFVLGCIHDLGYEFAGQYELHRIEGAKILKNSNYKYWKEVYYHGVVQTEYKSLALSLLNLADLIIDDNGNQITIEEKFASVEAKYGKNSAQYKRVTALYEQSRKDIDFE